MLRMAFGNHVLVTILLLVARASSTREHYSYENDIVDNLPGAPAHNFRHYSGYVNVNEEHGKALFYWLVEAESENAAEMPLTLWLAGGPGCSSVGGAMSELGPFFPTSNGQHLITNPHSWTQVSNMLFVEQPVGVGFSYSNISSDLDIGDHQAAKDVHTFLLAWFRKFPHYRSRDFYIAGESYAGHYIPHLAYHILHHVSAEDSSNIDLPINFKGFAVGNAWTDTVQDNFGTVDFWWERALISTQTYDALYKHCNFSIDFYDYYTSDYSLCSNVTSQALREMGNIDLYAIYFKQCVETSSSARTKTFLRQRRLYRPFLEKKETAPPALGAELASEAYDPCMENEVLKYLNRPEVQKALHANITGLSYPWVDCSNVLRYSERDVESTVLGLYKALLNDPIRIWVYSGDVDGVVPVEGTRKWIALLAKEGHLSHSKAWGPWYHGSQVGGHTEEFNGGNFKFVTVRNAGHEVPYTQPERALSLFTTFVAGGSLPTTASSERGPGGRGESSRGSASTR